MMIPKPLFIKSAICAIFAIAAIIGIAIWSPSGASAGLASKPSKDYVSLDLLAYNYTNQHIADYQVNGESGGIVRVSTPTSGGSGSVCCISLPLGKYETILIDVRWQVGGCVYVEKNPINGNAVKNIHYYYKQAELTIPNPHAVDPKHLETHFYPDGSVQVRITDEMSFPRLSLREDRLKNIEFPRCKNDEKPR
jgi:hypothetical protein